MVRLIQQEYVFSFVLSDSKYVLIDTKNGLPLKKFIRENETQDY